MKSIEKDPAWRHTSVREMGEDLGRCVEDRPIAARRNSPGQRAWLWCRSPS